MTKTKRLKKEWRVMMKTSSPPCMFEIFLHPDDAVLSGFWTKEYVESNFEYHRMLHIVDFTWKKNSA